MTKSKTKQGMPEMCYNCKYVDTNDWDTMTLTMPTKMTCSKTGKKHKWEYSCKKWMEMK